MSRGSNRYARVPATICHTASIGNTLYGSNMGATHRLPYNTLQVKMASLNDEVLAEAEAEMLYWDKIYRR